MPPTIIDNAIPDASGVRAEGLRAQYADWPGHDGEVYKRVSLTPVPGLQEAIEEPCRAAGADRIQMVHMPNSPPQAAALYVKLGYSTSESSYTKDI